MHHLALKNIGLATIFWLLAILPCALSSAVDSRPAIGFDLGQSYGTAVAHLPNGTIIKLAKVEGSLRYQAFLQSEIQKQQGSRWYPSRAEVQREELSRLLKQYTGLGGPYGAAILAEMLIPLRTASEAVLGAPLPATVVITAPYITAWRHEETEDSSFVERARKLAGLRPLTVDNMDPVYLGEANSVLAANGREICPDLRCKGPEWSDEILFRQDVVYFISFTNQSLYTSFQMATCFFHSPVGARLGNIDPDFGLNQQHQATDRASFWQRLQKHLISRVGEHAKIRDIYQQSYLVVVAGEAANTPEFLDAVRQTVTHIQNDPVHRVKETGTGPKVELLVSDDPTYAAAKGVAFWRRTMIDSSYCDDWFEAEEKYKSRQSFDREDRDEL
ncbi:hypothetical protein DCS_01741 [Drechmeria coniospora]|uniref:Uncharacterized protein n=1 Tax=Drechmeria coniospora TaxID=98403 RepID=A0A151GU05_DRECN|nr:hypothetical protein DCS_01741 [Drechmeria coniospora]KYK60604.1 hypothetical protein DCS_01741 [Drechmeria coniospora]